MLILDNIISTCSDPGIGVVITVLKRILDIIQIVGPIIFIIALVINFARMMMDPENKKLVKNCINSLVGALVIFAIPIFINVVMGMLSTNYTLSSCWNNVVVTDTRSTYISPNGKKQKQIFISPSDYEKGDPKKTDDDGGTVTGGSSITPGEAIIGDPNVKVRKNIYNKKASIVRKLNGQEVVDYAKTWIGKLHYDHGTTAELRPGGSCDCSQFIYRVLKHFDAVESEAPSIYCSMWSSGNVKGTILYSDLSHLVPGDVVADYWSDYSQHVEIYAGGNNTVGCDGNGVSIGHRANQYKTFIHLTAYD